MKHTPTYNLTQWELTDRIQMDNFNADNLKLEAALNQKLEPALLLDKTEELTDQTHWNIELPENPGTWFALFIEVTWPGVSIYLNPGLHGSGKAAHIYDGKAAVACFPLRNPEASVFFVPLYGAFEDSKATNYTYTRMTAVSIRHHVDNVNLPNGTYHARVWGFK